jgi:hypothetical protein
LGKKEQEILEQFKEKWGMNIYDKERNDFAIKTWVGTTCRVLAHMAERFGWDEVNDALKDFWKKRAEERMNYNVERVTKHGEPRDCVTLAEMLISNKAAVADYEFLEITPKRLHLRIRNCDEAEVLRETGLMGRLWWPCTQFWRRAYAEAFNPKIKYTNLRAECEGDEYCEEIWEMED